MRTYVKFVMYNVQWCGVLHHTVTSGQGETACVAASAGQANAKNSKFASSTGISTYCAIKQVQLQMWICGYLARVEG